MPEYVVTIYGVEHIQELTEADAAALNAVSGYEVVLKPDGYVLPGREYAYETAVRTTMFGPYLVEYDTEDFQTDAGHYVGLTLPEGTVIQTAWLECVTPFEPTANCYVAVNYCTAADPDGTWWAGSFYDLTDAQSNPDARRSLPLTSGPNTDLEYPIRCNTDLQVRVGSYFTPAPATAGAVNAYVIATRP